MKAKAAVSVLTIYLFAYAVLFHTRLSITILSSLFLIAPCLLLSMVYFVLKDDKQKYPDLGNDEEWGYRDKEKDQLGIF